jgi:predicted DNA-binding protein
MTMEKEQGIKNYLLNLPFSLWERLSEYSQAIGKPVSEVLRDAVEEFLNTRIGGKNAGKNA